MFVVYVDSYLIWEVRLLVFSAFISQSVKQTRVYFPSCKKINKTILSYDIQDYHI